LFRDNASRVKNRRNLHERIQRRLRESSLAGWADRFDRHEVPWAPVHTVTEALHDPQTRHNRMLVDMQHRVAGTITLMGHPVKFGETPAQYRLPPPGLGEHTEEILREAGYVDEQIRGLRERKVI
jgi:crotonobetainyl-CoA:carnitine CoA-transferase CaiB-like acyl-CoA transferase